MAIFNIKRGDSMPPIILAMRVAGTDPVEYWNVEDDDVGIGTVEDNAPTPSTSYLVRFIMKNLQTGELVGHPSNITDRFTGLGEIYQKTINLVNYTVLRYNWRAPDTAYDPALKTQASPTTYAGDTAKAGAYRGEFEVYYPGDISGRQRFKRTFPATPGDSLIINILPDENDKTVGEQV
jgi:hypothetical protein